MSSTPRLSLSYITAGQAQKEVTHNDALNDLDSLAQISVINMTTATPPASPATGDSYIIASSPTGAWSGYAGKIASWYSGWRIKTPLEGWRAWVQNSDRVYVFDGSNWVLPSASLAASGYLNFGTTTGSGGYGVRDNGGTIEYKNSGGSWASIGSGGGATSFSAGSSSAPGWAVTTDTDTGLFAPAANTLSLAAGGVEAARFNTAASAVNYLALTPSATTAAVVLSSAGSDANIPLSLSPKGSGAITLSNAATAASTLGVTGDFAVNTNKFNVAAASGNTSVAGTLGVTGAATLSGTLGVTGDIAVNTNKFNVTAASGNTSVAGTLGVTGAATLSSTLGVTGAITGSSTVTGSALIPTGSSAPANGMYLSAANTLAFATNGTMAFNIDSSQRVQMGSFANFAVGGGNPSFTVAGSSLGSSMVLTGRFSADSNPASVRMVKSRNATIGAHTAVQTGDALMRFSGYGSDGASFIEAGRFDISATGTIATNQVPGLLTLSLCNASGTLTSFLQIDGSNSGLVTAPGVNSNTTASAANVNVDTSGNLKKSTSSRRYKKDIADYTRGLEDLQKLRPVVYRSALAGDTPHRYAGLIAEEVAEAGLEEYVVRNQAGEPDALAYQNMVALLIKVAQDQAAEIAGLRTRMDALDGNQNGVPIALS